MPTIIDSLIVKLGLDTKDLSSQGGAASKQLKGLEDAGKSTEGSVKKLSDTSKVTAGSVDTLTKSVGFLLAALGGAYALRAFIEDTINSSAALERLSKNLSLSVEDVSAWGLAVEGLGGNAKGLQGTMSMLSQSQTELSLTGQSALIPYFASLNVALANTQGQARPVNEILLDLADRFGHMDRRQAFNLGKMMGIDTDTLNLLVQGRKEVELQIARQKDFNAVSKAQAEQSAKLQRSLIGLQQTFAALGRNLLQQASPAIEKVLGVLTNLGNWITRNTEFIKDLGIVLGVVAAGFALISIAASPITLTVAAIVALAAGIALLWNDYQVWQRGGQSILPWEKWKTEIDLAKTGLNDLRKTAISSFDAIVTAARVMWDAIHGNWGKLKTDLSSGTEKMNKPWGIGGPDNAHDQNAAKADRVVSSVRNFLVGTAKSVAGQGAGFEVPGTNTLTGSIAQVEGFNAKGKSPNRPQRNHNPGDIEYGPFAKAHGATGSDGRFAIFPNDATGFGALQALLQTKSYANLTIPQAINRFAPPSENNTAGYAASVMRSTGTSATTTVAQALAGAGNSPGGGGGNTDKSVTLNTGPITVHTAATDANGVARDLTNAIKWQLAAQANSGLS